MKDPRSQTEELVFYSKGGRKVQLWNCVLKTIASSINLEGPEQGSRDQKRVRVCTRRKVGWIESVLWRREATGLRSNSLNPPHPLPHPASHQQWQQGHIRVLSAFSRAPTCGVMVKQRTQCAPQFTFFIVKVTHTQQRARRKHKRGDRKTNTDEPQPRCSQNECS